jgi:putative aldouronate transport system substrate-binding protein
MKKFTVLLLVAILLTGTLGSLSALAQSQLPYEELVIAWLKIGECSDMQRIEDKVNEILMSKLNCKVHFEVIDTAEYAQQITLAMSSHQQIDLAISGDWINYSTNVASGIYLPLNDLLQKYGQNILANVPADIIACSNYNGAAYGVPTIREWATDFGVSIRSDILKKYGIDPTTVKSWEELTPMYKTVVDGEKIPTVCYESAGDSVLSGFYSGYFDSLSDFNGVLDYSTGDTKVVNLYETPSYLRFAKLAKEWNDIGAIPANASTMTEAHNTLCKAGSILGYISKMKPGYDNKESISNGFPMVSIHLSDVVQSTGTVANIMYSIPYTTIDADRAMMVLNELYGNADVVNLLSYGEKDVDYKVGADGIATFADGVNANNAKYNPTWSWMVGNQFLATPWTPDAATIWDETKVFNGTGKKSPAMGFIFDPSPVSAEVAAVENVKAQYEDAIGNGEVEDVEASIAEFNKALYDAGLQTIIDEKQKQLNAFLGK